MERWRRARSDDGAVAVEAAIITPVLLLIVFGIIEFALLLKDDLSVASAVRAGSRTASALPRYPGFAQQAADQVARSATVLDLEKAEMWVYRAGPSGDPPAACGNDCIVFHWNTTTKSFEVTGGGGWAATSINACPGDPGQDSVGVYLKYPHALVTGIFGGTVTLTDHSVMIFEPVPPTQGCK